MGETASYEIADGVARIGLDDGKVNLMSPAMLNEIGAGLDRIEKPKGIAHA